MYLMYLMQSALFSHLVELIDVIFFDGIAFKYDMI